VTTKFATTTWASTAVASGDGRRDIAYVLVGGHSRPRASAAAPAFHCVRSPNICSSVKVSLQLPMVPEVLVERETKISLGRIDHHGQGYLKPPVAEFPS
jgi:hypothetical protein